jgi:CRISPR type I-E-associated protein CasB/Cse2
VIDTSTGEKVRPVWERAASEALQTRGRGDLAWKRNELRGGIDVIGEHYAVPHLAPLMAECQGRQQQQQRDAIVRAAAITAINDHCPQKSFPRQGSDQPVRPYRLGHAMRALTRQRTGQKPSAKPAKRDSVAKRLALLPEMDFDSAVDTISALISFANSERISVNFYDLAETLFFWGQGLTDNSVRVRNRVLSDYYGATDAPRKAI